MTTGVGQVLSTALVRKILACLSTTPSGGWSRPLGVAVTCAVGDAPLLGVTFFPAIPSAAET